MLEAGPPTHTVQAWLTDACNVPSCLPACLPACLQWTHAQINALSDFYEEDFGQHNRPSKPPRAVPAARWWRGCCNVASCWQPALGLSLGGQAAAAKHQGACCCSAPTPAPPLPASPAVQSWTARRCSLPSSKGCEQRQSGSSWAAAAQPSAGAPCGCGHGHTCALPNPRTQDARCPLASGRPARPSITPNPVELLCAPNLPAASRWPHTKLFE